MAAGQGPGAGDTPRWLAQHEAFSRLEDVLHSLPFDRAVPDLPELLERADVDEELLRHDDRARKLVHEALLARPFGTFDSVRRVRTEVELLTLEVEVLADRLGSRDLSEGDAARTSQRLHEVRERLDEINQQL